MDADSYWLVGCVVEVETDWRNLFSTSRLPQP